MTTTTSLQQRISNPIQIFDFSYQSYIIPFHTFEFLPSAAHSHNHTIPTIRHMQPIEVTWRPPQPFLHYQRLYWGIHCYLRAPPDPEHHADAQQYLEALIESRQLMTHFSDGRALQDDRIRWVREWIRAMPSDCNECSDAETVEHDIESER